MMQAHLIAWAWLAQESTPPAGGSSTFTSFLLPLIIVFVIMYLFVVAPQRKREKKRRQMLDAVRKGDRVVTIGGIHGTAVQVKDKEIVVEVADKTRMRFSRGAIARVEKEGDEGDDEKT
jgi:preprotein translocase subunit YajC